MLSIEGKSYCDSACVFCVEKFANWYAISPKVDETRELVGTCGECDNERNELPAYRMSPGACHLRHRAANVASARRR